MTFSHPVFLFALFCLLLASPCRAARSAEGSEKPQLVGKKVHLNDDEQEKLRRWKAGETVSPQAVRRYGEWRCFSADTISNAVFARMWGKSYKKGCSIPRSKLRYVKVLHINGAGRYSWANWSATPTSLPTSSAFSATSTVLPIPSHAWC